MNTSHLLLEFTCSPAEPPPASTLRSHTGGQITIKRRLFSPLWTSAGWQLSELWLQAGYWSKLTPAAALQEISNCRCCTTLPPKGRDRNCRRLWKPGDRLHAVWRWWEQKTALQQVVLTMSTFLIAATWLAGYIFVLGSSWTVVSVKWQVSVNLVRHFRWGQAAVCGLSSHTCFHLARANSSSFHLLVQVSCILQISCWNSKCLTHTNIQPPHWNDPYETQNFQLL